jgi:FkbM family methyltransferase
MYGFGAGEDISWDIAMIENFKAHMYIFDFTPRSIKYVNSIIKEKGYTSEQLTFLPEGLADTDGSLTFTLPENKEWVSMRLGDHSKGDASRLMVVPVNRLDTYMARLGHSMIDVLKIDIEGAEYGVLEDLVKRNYFPFRQLLVVSHLLSMICFDVNIFFFCYA